MMATCVYRSVIVFFHLMVWTVEVCPETTIVGFIGDSIVIPCSSEEHQPSIQDITVRWRYNFLNVYDIIKGADSEEEQDPAYKNRVETFPKEYLKGNYSLRLNNLQNTDTGPYTCYIIEESIMQNVNLIIEGFSGFWTPGKTDIFLPSGTRFDISDVEIPYHLRFWQ
ncbi:CD276 antigen homolog isoform X2 [Pseudorasbora parva]|uniref:CD276 antigen homolog isoform X2 n=1 Tax=Pseudorasbora parva TaxID=51549 RepID=UPI00351DF092